MALLTFCALGQGAWRSAPAIPGSEPIMSIRFAALRHLDLSVHSTMTKRKKKTLDSDADRNCMNWGYPLTDEAKHMQWDVLYLSHRQRRFWRRYGLRDAGLSGLHRGCCPATGWWQEGLWQTPPTSNNLCIAVHAILQQR